jgi:hypothetical protein
VAGFCTRHQIKKGERSHQYCKGVGDKAYDYWLAWEQGRLGATAPASPILSREDFGDGKPEPDKSTIGTALSEIFEGVTGRESECEECKKAILRLNGMTAEQVEADRAAIIADIKGRIPTQAPTLWKILAKIDDALHLGQVDSRLDAWLTEAIEKGKAQPEPSKKN